jgi:hypothetical protein
VPGTGGTLDRHRLCDLDAQAAGAVLHPGCHVGAHPPEVEQAGQGVRLLARPEAVEPGHDVRIDVGPMLSASG